MSYTQICFICSNKADIQFTDYVERHPMICCWSCQSKFVIDCPMENNDIEDFSGNKTFDLLFIKRIVNSLDFDNFLDNYNKNNNSSFEYTDELCEHMDISEDELKKRILDDAGVELNSYNIRDIHKKNPDYDLSHDGTFILIEVLEKDGNLTRMYFWGD
jgi:hypothetical protein